MEISEQNTKDGAIPAGQTPDTDISLEGSSGISKEDQAEIAARIDSIAQANRISVTPEVLVVRASKPGFIFPLFVNAGAVVLLISGFLILSAFHSRDDSEIRRESSTATRSAEGRLIQEIRKETAAELQAKDQEIAYITARLSGVGEELGRLSTEMEDRIREREDDLRRQMDQQIEAERRRLLSLNLSEEVIAERMRAFEAEQIVLFNENLAGYRRQLEEDRVAAEINLNKLREEYERNLETLNAERAQALETARLREANARHAVTDNSAEIDALFEQDRENLMSAREELQRLTGEQERSQAIEWQISGYYNTAVNQIRNQQLEAAADTLTALRLFMDT
ncbi:MAG: hypothetical protein LBP32_08735, partial [Spirochaetaceae bacterium]|nr:hypothetical protein [Spirochaetaceae bacterium]